MSEEKNCVEDPSGWLAGVLEEMDCQTGTLHRADGEWLDLVASIGVPDALMPVISRIPFGKGIAGVAASTRKPVELCNLQQDLGGVAKEGARQTEVSGSLAVPVFDESGGKVIGTLGVGMHAPHDFSEDEKERLASFARELWEAWA